ncbi:MAG: hypothetical protein LBS53_04615 [Synergistaceae bacterium]|jgi:hypothetical protein|nr:hypothetical protein [Synergistaceae bacterium]
MDDGGEEEIKKREKAEQALGLRRNMYEHINISVKTLDIIIAAVFLSTVALIIIGIITRS